MPFHPSTPFSASPSVAPPAARPSATVRLESIAQRFAEAVGADVALVCVHGAEPRRRGSPRAAEVLCSWGARPESPLARSLGGAFVASSLVAQRTVHGPLDGHGDARLAAAAGGAPLTYAVATPVRGPGRRAVALVAAFASPPHDAARRAWLAESFAGVVALALDFPEVLDGLMAGRQRDALTGCLSYEYTLAELDREVDRSARSGLPLALCFIDLDGFKQINDRHGHLAGNRVLAAVGRVLRARLRRYDAVGRYGGDEFVVILPQTALGDARVLAGEVQALIAATPIEGVDGPVTASVGIAGWTKGATPESLLARADEELLRVKRVRVSQLTTPR